MSDSVAPGTVGFRLHEGRQRTGLSLKEMAEKTCIRRTYLEALEADRFDLLPGEVYAQGFTRIYAKVVGLDAEPLLAQIRQLKETGQFWVEDPVDIQKQGRPLLWVCLLLIVVGLVGGFLYRQIGGF